MSNDLKAMTQADNCMHIRWLPCSDRLPNLRAIDIAPHIFCMAVITKKKTDDEVAVYSIFMI